MIPETSNHIEQAASCHTPTIEAKACSKCSREKLFSEFHSKGNDRFDSRCKSCVSEEKAKKYKKMKKLSKEGNAKRRKQRIDTDNFEIVETYTNSKINVEYVTSVLLECLLEEYRHEGRKARLLLC